MQKKIKILILGIGNPGRGDDGLGPKLVEQLENEGLKTADFGFRYQLNVEDALTVKDYEIVVFADSCPAGERPATLTEIGPSKTMSFSTHEMAPDSILALCQELYGRRPQAYILAIRGYDWDIREALSDAADKNLARAIDLLKIFLKNHE